MKRTASDKRKGEESEDLRRQRSVKWDEGVNLGSTNVNNSYLLGSVR